MAHPLIFKPFSRSGGHLRTLGAEGEGAQPHPGAPVLLLDKGRGRLLILIKKN